MQVGQPFNPYGIFLGAFIPNAILRSEKLSPTSKLLYAQLCRYAGANGECWPKQSRLAEDIGLGVRQVNTNIKQLVDEGFLLVFRTGLNQPNRYEFLWHKSLTESLRRPPADPDTQDSAHPDSGYAENSVSDTQDSAHPLVDSLNLKDSDFEESHGRESTARAQDENSQSPPPTPPAESAEDGPAPLHERNLAKGIERMAKAVGITQCRLSQPFKQQLKRTDEVKRREGQEEFEAWRGLLGAGVIDYGADQSVGTLEQALRKLKSFGSFPTRDHRPTGAVTANGPAPPAGACQKLITGIARENTLSFEGHIPTWKWAVLEAIWFKDRDEFIERARKHFASCVSFDMSGNGALEAFIDSEKANNRPKPKNEISSEELAEWMEEHA